MNLWRRVPADPDEWFSADQISQSRRYNRTRQRIAMANAGLSVAGVIVIIATRAIERTTEALGVEHWAGVFFVSVAVVLVGLEILTIPVDPWRLRHERRWEQSDRTTRRWLLEELANLPLALVLFSAVGLPLYALMRSTDLWWLFGWLVFLVFVSLLAAIYPIVVVPLTNRLVPLEDIHLGERLRRLSREAGVAITGVYVMNASKQTRKEGAFIGGLGPWRRLVLYDNLLKRSPREIEVVLAHEVGHWRHRHVLKALLASNMLMLLTFWLLSLLADLPVLLSLLRVDDFADPASLPFVALYFGIAASAINGVRAWLRRRFERVCDLDALEFTRDAATFIDSTRGMATHNLAELDPSWWHRVRSDSPAPAERLALAKWWQARRRVTVLFTDIENSTPLVERLGDRGWYELLTDHDEIVRRNVAEHNGTEVDSAGDGFLVVFDDAGEALLCALEVQRELNEYAFLHPDAHVRVRMGLHTGDVIRRGKQIYGREVHLAARVSTEAAGGEVLVSDAVRDALGSTERFTFGDPRHVELKGFEGAHSLRPVVTHLP